MRINRAFQPKSSFLSVEKDLSIIIGEILKNPRIKRLLYYTTDNAVNERNLNEDESLNLIGKNIKLVPKLYIDKDVLNYLYITFDSFYIGDNPEFKDNLIIFDIVCHFDQWQLKDFQLRPYRIAAELDSILNHKKLTGIGEINFVGMKQVNYNNEFGGLSLLYQVWHGEEDKKYMPNPMDEERFQKDWYDYINDTGTPAE